MDEKNTFTVMDENGKEVSCEVLFTFDSEETKNNYIVYTDNTTDDEGNVHSETNSIDEYVKIV